MQLYHGLHSNPSLPSQLYSCDSTLKQQPREIYLTSSDAKHSRTLQAPQLLQQQDTTGVSASISFLSTFLDDASVELGTVDKVVLDSSRHSIDIELMDELLQALQDEAPADAVTPAMPAAVPAAAAAACHHAGLIQQQCQRTIRPATHVPNWGAVGSLPDCNACSNQHPAAAMPASAEPAVVSPSPFAQYSTQDATFSQQQLQQIIDEEMQRMGQAPASAAPAVVTDFRHSQGQQQQQQYQLSLQVPPQPGPCVENTSSPCMLTSPAMDSAHTGSRPSLDDSAMSLTVMSSAASSSSSGLLTLQQGGPAKSKSPVSVCTPCDRQQPACSLAPAAAAEPGASAMDISMQYIAELEQQHGVLGSIPRYAAVAASGSASGGGHPFAAAMDNAGQYDASTDTTVVAVQQWQQQQHSGLGSSMPQHAGYCMPGAAMLGDSPSVSHAVTELTGQHQTTSISISSYNITLPRHTTTPCNEAMPSVSNKQQQLQHLQRCLVKLQKLQQLREQDSEEACTAPAVHSTQQSLLQLPASQQIIRANSEPCETADMQQLLQQSGLCGSCTMLSSTEQQERLLLQYSKQQQMARVSSVPCNLAAMQQQLGTTTDSQVLFQAEQQINGPKLRSRSDEARKSVEQRRSSIEQRRSFEHKLFKARRPLQPAVTPPCAAVNLAISDRVKARIQWQHQQRQLQHQLERKLRQQNLQHQQLINDK